MARLGLLKITDNVGYTEYTDIGGCGFVGRTLKGWMGAGRNVCVQPGVGTYAQMLTRTDLLGWPGAEFVTVDSTYSRIRWTPNAAATYWRPINGSALLLSGIGKMASAIETVSANGLFTSRATLIPNLLKPGTRLGIELQLRKKGNNATAPTITLYVGTAGTTGDSAIYVQPAITATTNRDIRIDTSVTSFDATTLTGPGATTINSADTNVTAGTVTTNINTASTMYVSIGISTLGGADTVDLISYCFTLRAP